MNCLNEGEAKKKERLKHQAKALKGFVMAAIRICKMKTKTTTTAKTIIKEMYVYKARVINNVN